MDADTKSSPTDLPFSLKSEFAGFAELQTSSDLTTAIPAARHNTGGYSAFGEEFSNCSESEGGGPCPQEGEETTEDTKRPSGLGEPEQAALGEEGQEKLKGQEPGVSAVKSASGFTEMEEETLMKTSLLAAAQTTESPTTAQQATATPRATASPQTTTTPQTTAAQQATATPQATAAQQATATPQATTERRRKIQRRKGAIQQPAKKVSAPPPDRQMPSRG